MNKKQKQKQKHQNKTDTGPTRPVTMVIQKLTWKAVKQGKSCPNEQAKHNEYWMHQNTLKRWITRMMETVGLHHVVNRESETQSVNNSMKNNY